MTEMHVEVEVSAYAGYRGEEAPQCFYLQDRKVEVVRIVDRWLSPGQRYFKIIGDDKNTYVLRYNISKNQWELSV